MLHHKKPSPKSSKAKLEHDLVSFGPPPLDVPRNVNDIRDILKMSKKPEGAGRIGYFERIAFTEI